MKALLTSLTIFACCLFAARVYGDDLQKQASWDVPTSESVKPQVDAWLATQELDEIAELKLEAIWPEEEAPVAGAELLDRVAVTFAIANPEADKVVQFSRTTHKPGLLPKFTVLTDETVEPFVQNNLKLLFARWLVQHKMHNEATEVLEGLQVSDVVDPATMLFYQSCGYHRLLDKDKCLPAISQLLENEEQIPNRYATVAKLMEADLKPLKVDSLDEVARIMRNVEDRLGLGRAGTRVRKEEDDIVAKLDKIIEEKEKQGGGGGGGGGGGSGNGSGQPSSPMQDSNGGANKGPGDVDNRNTPSDSKWGDLPPEEREKVLQQLGRELPAHYRQVIEEYFRKLARDGVEKK